MPNSVGTPSTSNSFEILAQASEDPGPNHKIAPPLNDVSPHLPPSNHPPESQPLKDVEADPTISQKELKENINDMEVDGITYQYQSIDPSIAGGSQVQQMDEEAESIDMEGLDIFQLEMACKKRDYDKITELQLSKLEVVISKAYQQRQLGIQPGSHWDGGLRTKDFKKRGRKTELQRTIEVEKFLVDSGRYAKLTKYYKPSPNVE